MRWSLLAREASAYLQSGLLLTQRGRVHREAGPGARRAVIFVPGVGGHGAQFLGFRRALERDTDAFFAFEYSSLVNPERQARRLREELEKKAADDLHLVIIGHSLGGVVARIALQSAARLPLVSFVAICAPLAGTWRSRLIPTPALRALRPDSALMQRVRRDGHRLDRYRGRILTVAASHDLMVKPSQSAHLPGHPAEVMADQTHNAALLDPRLHAMVAGFIQSCGPA